MAIPERSDCLVLLLLLLAVVDPMWTQSCSDAKFSLRRLSGVTTPAAQSLGVAASSVSE